MRPRTRIVSTRLDAVRRQLDRWRRGHRPPTPIPEELWGAAVELAAEHGAYGTSRALRLNYHSLRKRVDAARLDRSPVRDGRAAFVEFVPLAGTSGIAECVVELENGGGARMRIQVKGGSSADVVSLARALWRGER